jgi:hypothetical protein
MEVLAGMYVYMSLGLCVAVQMPCKSGVTGRGMTFRFLYPGGLEVSAHEYGGRGVYGCDVCVYLVLNFCVGCVLCFSMDLRHVCRYSYYGRAVVWGEGGRGDVAPYAWWCWDCLYFFVVDASSC